MQIFQQIYNMYAYMQAIWMLERLLKRSRWPSAAYIIIMIVLHHSTVSVPLLNVVSNKLNTVVSGLNIL